MPVPRVSNPAPLDHPDFDGYYDFDLMRDMVAQFGHLSDYVHRAAQARDEQVLTLVSIARSVDEEHGAGRLTDEELAALTLEAAGFECV